MISTWQKELTLKEALNVSMSLYTSNLALWVEGKTYTYKDLYRRALVLIDIIENTEKLPLQSHVAIFTNKSLSAYVGIIASVLGGHIYMPLNPRFPHERNLFMLNKSSSQCMIVDKDCEEEARALLKEVNDRSIIVAFPEYRHVPEWCKTLTKHKYYALEGIQKDLSTRAIQEINPDHGVYNLFTSGTTGNPKSVIVTHHNVMSYLKNIYDIHKPAAQDKFTQFFDLTFDLSVHDMFLCWLCGAALYVVPSNAGLMATRFVQEHALTYWFSVPSAAGLLKEYGLIAPNSMPSLKVSLFCGEALSSSLASAWQEAAPNSRVLNLYGPTEATIAFTYYECSSTSEEGVVPIGRPFSSQEICIIDDAFNLVEDGTLGELCLAGSQVTSGYDGAPDLTKQKFITLAHSKPSQIWYRTGDLVRWEDEKGIIFCGRVDRQIKIKGFRVELQEIEAKLRQITKSEIVAVIPYKVKNLKDGYAGTIAFVNKGVLEKEDIMSGCKSLLPDYMRPHEIIFIDSLPKNSNQKVDYNALAAMIDLAPYNESTF